jgi:hypothetical protein
MFTRNIPYGTTTRNTFGFGSIISHCTGTTLPLRLDDLRLRTQGTRVYFLLEQQSGPACVAATQQQTMTACKLI